MKHLTKTILLIFLGSNICFAFDLNSFAKEVIGGVKDKKETQTTNLSSDTVSSGLKEALKVGVNYAVENLSKEDGYLNNKLVKIPLPENLKKVESLIKKVGGEKVTNDLVKSMNSAASQAAPKTAKIFIEAIEKMSLEDAKTILNGNKDAATNYFKTNTSSKLKEAIKPIVEKSMKQNSVAQYYDSFNSYYKKYAKNYVDSRVTGIAKNFGVDSYLPSASDENLDEFITQKAIDGLFTMIAQKEADIRANPLEQTSSLLKKVFSK